MEMVYRLIVDDQPGVLDRIVGLVRRHARNITFLMVFGMEEAGRSLLTFKLVDGMVDASLSERILEIESVHSLETVPDDITQRVMALGR